MEFVTLFFRTLWDIFLEMSPYLLLGFLFAGILNVLVTKEKVAKFLGKKGTWSSIKASIIGVPLPLCSCGVIPTGVSFHKNGASKGATNSFLISTPQTGFDSILITYSLMNIYWAIARPIIAFITGVFGGVATDYLTKETDTPNPIISNSFSTQTESSPWYLRIFTYAFIDFLGDISRQLLLGILLAILITIFIPQTLFTEYLNNPILNMFIILIAAIPMYVCATGSVPIATALLIAGVSPGAVLVFLMAGPATNIATLTVLWKSIGEKATLIYLFSIILGALFFGILIDYVLDPKLFSIPSINASHIHGEGLMYWISIISSVLLIALLLFVELKKIIPTKINTIKMNHNYTVNGMTCNHCKSSVEKNVSKLEGVKSVIADPNTNSVNIEGEFNEEDLKTTIDDLGFTFVGKQK
jgi:hypothetical protein